MMGEHHLRSGNLAWANQALERAGESHRCIRPRELLHPDASRNQRWSPWSALKVVGVGAALAAAALMLGGFVGSF